MPDDDGELRGLIRMEMRGNTDVIANRASDHPGIYQSNP